MLKKEFSDAFKKLMECMILLLGVPLGVLFDRFIIQYGWKLSDIFHYVFLATIIAYPLAAGLTIFQSEKKNRAFEYLFSLPLSRFKILLYKIAPRFMFLLLLIIASIFFSIFDNIWINGFNLIVVFFISTFLSISINSFVIGVIGISFFYSAYTQASRSIHVIFIGWDPAKFNDFSTVALLFNLLTAALLLIPMGTAFWMTFKRFDVKPLKWQLKSYLYIVVSTVLVFYSFIILVFKKVTELSG
jgi:ABC-type Na+ efflux pump permease subunit